MESCLNLKIIFSLFEINSTRNVLLFVAPNLFELDAMRQNQQKYL